MDYKPVSLETLNSGAAAELFEEELKKVLENIADPNTSAESTREIRLIFKIKPNKTRDSAVTHISATSKLEAAEPSESFVILERTNSGFAAYATDIKQPELPLEDGKVRSISREA